MNQLNRNNTVLRRPEATEWTKFRSLDDFDLIRFGLNLVLTGFSSVALECSWEIWEVRNIWAPRNCFR